MGVCIKGKKAEILNRLLAIATDCNNSEEKQYKAAVCYWLIQFYGEENKGGLISGD